MFVEVKKTFIQYFQTNIRPKDNEDPKLKSKFEDRLFLYV